MGYDGHAHLLSIPALGTPPLLPFRCSQEIRRIWVGYWSQCDAMLGQKLAAKLHSAGAI